VSLFPRVTVNSCGRPVAGVWPFTVYDSPGGRGGGLPMTGWLVPPSASGIATADATATAETAPTIPERPRRPGLTRRTRAARSSAVKRGGSASDAASRERSSRYVGVARNP
jgi:hypothetical protein